jgi:hypothetical protein
VTEYPSAARHQIGALLAVPSRTDERLDRPKM